MTWKWKGPYNDGISTSMIGRFLTDPFTFYLYYGLGLEESAPQNTNLIWGSLFHIALEKILQSPLPVAHQPESFWEELFETIKKESSVYPYCQDTIPYSVIAMARLYNDDYRLRYPFVLNDDLPPTPPSVVQTEISFLHKHRTSQNIVYLKGIIDGLMPYAIVDHKCKKKYDRTIIKQELPWDLQMNMYWLAHPRDILVYDLIRIPEVQWNLPPRKSGEWAKAYVHRLFTQGVGDYPINKKKFVWMDKIVMPFNIAILTQWISFTLNPIIDRICDLYDYCLPSSFDFQDPAHYNSIFYKQPLRHFNPAVTEKWTRDYHNYLTNQINLDDLTPVKRFQDAPTIL